MVDKMQKILDKDINEIVKDIQECANEPENRKEELATSLALYEESKNINQSASLWQFGLPVQGPLLKTINGINNEPKIVENTVINVVDNYIKQYKTGKKHSERRKNLELALKQLLKFYTVNGGEVSSEILSKIAEIYLFRSAIMRPKGRTIPEKKIEALHKGLKFINEIPSDDMGSKSLKIRASLHLELEKVSDEKGYWDKLDDGQNKEKNIESLKQALTKASDDFKDTYDYARIAVKYNEVTGDGKEYLQNVINSQNPHEGFNLQKAKANYLRGNDEGTKDCMNMFVKELTNLPFAHPVWEETVEFLQELRLKKKEYWKALTLSVYYACQEKEKETVSLHLRWYWSRQRALYDLAVDAADDVKNKTRIADSLKNRPSLHWQAMEDMTKDEKIKSVYEANASAIDGNYVTGNKRSEIVIGKVDLKKRDFTDIPENCVVIHFYISQCYDEEKGYNVGYAFIFNKEKEEWKEEKFNYDKLFNAFLTWQINYFRYKEGAADYLVALCETIGETMPFLFDLPKEKSVLFIPHDFLQRIPLHGAIKNNGADTEVLLEKHKCSYLPAWPPETSVKDKSDKKPSGIRILRNFNQVHFDDLKEKIETNEFNKFIDKASADDLEEITTPLELFVLICHGEADVVNPFNARLKLAGDGITQLNILNSDTINLNGTKVILGACETDLAPPLSGVLDEHLSIASTLMSKGATDVLGTMWKTNSSYSEEVIENAIDKLSVPLVNIINDWQKEVIEEWKGTKCNTTFYYTIPFRIFFTSYDK